MHLQFECRSTYCLAIVLSGLANLTLGASSLYWRALDDVPSIILITYRITLSSVTLGLFILIYRRFNTLRKITPTLIAVHCAASVFIALNWGAFIWSSINGLFLESGLGYLLAPFISLTMGTVISREKITQNKVISICVALISVILLIVFSERLNHWSYLIIACTWGAYTCIKKTTSLDIVSGLFLEMLFLTICLIFAFFLLGLPIDQAHKLFYYNPLIWLAGGVTITPLLMFSFAAKRIPLSLTGILQPILPLTLLSIGLYFYGQQIPTLSLTFTIITTGALLTLLAFDLADTRTQENKEANK